MAQCGICDTKYIFHVKALKDLLFVSNQASDSIFVLLGLSPTFNQSD